MTTVDGYKRYKLTHDIDGPSGMMQACDGGWVKLADYQAMIAERDQYKIGMAAVEIERGKLEAERDTLAQRLRMIISHATSGRMTGEDLSVNDICTEVTGVRNAIFREGKDHADKDLQAANLSLVAQVAKQEAEAEDAELLQALEANMWDLRSFSDQTIGGDDSQPGWEVIEYHMTEPKTRVIGTSFSEDPRPAIREALKGPDHE